MSIIKKNKIYLVVLFVNLMFSFRIVAQSYLMVDFNYWPLTVIFVLSVMGYVAFNSIPDNLFQKLLLIAIIITSVFGGIYYFGLKTDLYLQVINNVGAINDAVKSTTVTYYEQYKLFFMCFIPLLVFMFLIFAEKGITNLVSIYLMAVMILFWYLGFPKIVIKNLWIFTFIQIMSFGINNIIGALSKFKKSNSNIDINNGKLFLFILIPAILISFVTSKLPQEYKSNYVEVINEKIISTFNPLKNNLVKAAYGLESSGYSSDVKKLGGPINLNDKLVLSVNADRSEYLRGSIKDNYNGFSWSKNKQDYSLKINEKHNVLSSKNFSPGFASNGKKLLVYLDQNTNSSIFAPMYTYNVKLDKGDVFYDDAPTFIADLSKVKSYSVDYYDNLETQAFENCSDLDWLKESLNQGDSSEFKKKYENYLQVPSTITQRTKTLLTDFSTLGASRYASISKMKEYLDINYPYTTSVSPVPKDQDFIDNFLFTEKKGYCVYFATAATVLSRMMGIPARYVEGFKMPESKDSEGLYKVTNKEAHAWCEVLVDPIHDIWTTLEVTPAAVSNQVPEVIPEPIVEVSKTIAKPEVKLPSTVKNNADPTNNISLGSYKISKVGIGMYIFLSIVILLIAKILTTLGGIKKILRRKSIIPYYKYCVKRLKQIGIVKKSNLGDLEYVEQLEDKALKVILKDIVIIAYEEFYGKKFEGDINRENSYKELENFIKRKEKKSLYFIKKYLFF